MIPQLAFLHARRWPLFSKDRLAHRDKENPNPERIANTHAIHTGIAARKWSRKFVLADDVEVGSASIQDGILSVPITKIIPEEKKPKKISIGTKKLSKEFLTEHDRGF